MRRILCIGAGYVGGPTMAMIARKNPDVEVTVVPGGSVTGTAGDASFSGRWEKNQLQLGQYRFKVERSGNGFKAVEEKDSAHSVQFRRVGSGY